MHFRLTNVRGEGKSHVARRSPTKQWKVLGTIPGVAKSTQYRGALSQLHNALAAVQLYNSVVRGL